MGNCPRYRHLKSGRIYRLQHVNATIEATNTPAVMYECEEDGSVWVRPRDEFFDGRFERLDSGGLATVDTIPDRDLLKRFLQVLADRETKGRRGVPLWAAVMSATALGSTFAAQLCERFGHDPDKLVKRFRV